jgi:hypothetical protein
MASKDPAPTKFVDEDGTHYELLAFKRLTDDPKKATCTARVARRGAKSYRRRGDSAWVDVPLEWLGRWRPELVPPPPTKN